MMIWHIRLLEALRAQVAYIHRLEMELIETRAADQEAIQKIGNYLRVIEAQ